MLWLFTGRMKEMNTRNCVTLTGNDEINAPTDTMKTDD